MVGFGGGVASAATDARGPGVTAQVNETATNTTEGYTVRGLSRTLRFDAPASVRPWGDMGQIWLRHVPVGLLTPNDPANASRYVRPYTTVQRKAVYLGSYRGWTADPLDLTVRIVTWNKGTRVENSSSGRRVVEVPRNVTVSDVSVTLPGGGYDRAKVELPRFYDTSKRVTMWVVGHRETTQWTFRLKTSKATQSVPIGSLGGVIKWSLFNIFIYVLGVAGGLVVLDAKVMRKVGKGPQWGRWSTGSSGSRRCSSGVRVLRGYHGHARAPSALLGVLGGVFIGGLVLYAMSGTGERSLFLQPRAETGEVLPDGSGTWWWANRVHTVVEREKDGKKVIPRSGWLPFLARAWPFVDATPVMEFSASEQRKLEAPPEDFTLPDEDESSVWDRIRTRIEGRPGEGDEFDTIYLVDPLADASSSTTRKRLSGRSRRSCRSRRTRIRERGSAASRSRLSRSGR
ncbi:hypothetical protein ACFQRB_16055 [Halobaculum litoreum]|uniref:DUF2207 domain-containing protein n=1 Tax=Halobaculum litoreum TaxID=3031998 RepID=A0ABD5XWH5_9EURY